MIERLLDLVWPRTCAVCSRPVDRPGRHLCADCLNRVPFIAQTGACAICGRAIEGGAHEFTCDDCAAARPAFDRAASAVRFEGRMRELILGYKFNRHLWLLEDFSDFLEAAVRARFDVAAADVVLPMPTTWFHRMDRGYNPCVYLARQLARRIDRRFDGRVLARQGSPRRQSDLAADERFENVKGTFDVRRADWIRGRTVLVVDDILTTGATLSEAAKTLKAAGAVRVWAVTLARSIL